MERIGYLDTSVFLRPIIKEPAPLSILNRFSRLYSSRLLKVESLRTLHRLLIERTLNEHEFTLNVETALQSLHGVGIVPITEAILRRAEAAMPFALGTLDGIHLATAIVLKEKLNEEIEFLTHDQRLGNSAKALGFSVSGVA